MASTFGYDIYGYSSECADILLIVQLATSAAATRSNTTIKKYPPPCSGQSIYIDGFAAARQLQLEHLNY